MITPLLAALLAIANPAGLTVPDDIPSAETAPMPALSLSAQATLRCSAAFAMVAHGQSIGNEDARQWPDLATRGREFFVRSLAQLMDETGLDRAGIAALVEAEAQRLWDSGETQQVMPACLVMLGAADL
ncbi:hypothetical protein [Erythrobacter sp.]|jgi:hypothetical protein|uniref:hypothetical protein n=1 Tax=Erythrobacter sp. TaxID=1042 RepID=UPI002EA55094|nr:hypothetical protein [Erythrobacter sp.]